MTRNEQFVHPPLVIRIVRIAAIAYALFLSIFALDVFGTGLPLGETLLALGIHLVPTFSLLIFAWIAWKNPLIGGILFILVGIVYVVEAGGQAFTTYLIIAGIPIAIGLLFIWGYCQNRKA